ncbi:MAG: hypothetical protein F4234_12720 [Gammaproteobacteria bacterium]|nr:hypothetical protein [Gammaproteobacteria bacterium]MYF01005.1 hypothetical protein [Gammaproteobacteria bacterium]MYG97677.1 hypothetical protein [Gammaproteobacteria bacterium]
MSSMRLYILLWLLLLAGCGASTGVREPSVLDREEDTIAGLLARAETAAGVEAALLRLDAGERLLAEGRLSEAEQVAEAAMPAPPELEVRLILLRSRINLAADDGATAMARLREIGVPGRSADYFVDYYQLLGDINSVLEQPRQAIGAWAEVSGLRDGAGGEDVRRKIWATLEALSGRELEEMAASSTSYELRGWIELARVVDSGQYSIPRQLESLVSWRRSWEQHSAARQLPEQLRQLEAAWAERPRHIALILPLREAAGAAIQQGFLAGYYEALAVSREVPRISLFDSSGAADILPIYERAVTAGADLIVGPLFKDLVNQLLEAGELPTPTLALNYTDADPLPGDGRLFQFALAPEDEIDAIIDLAWQAGHRNAAAIYPANDVFLRLQNIFAERWQARGGSFVSRAAYLGAGDFTDVVKSVLDIDASEARLQRLLDVLPRSNVAFTPRRRRDIDFIFLMANPQVGRQIKPALDFYFADDLPVFALPSIYDGSDNPDLNRDLEGVIFADAPLMWLDLDVPLASGGTERRLQAMGIDSFRLYPRLQQFLRRQVTSLRGATGELYMEESRRIHRRLTPGRFENGVAAPLAEPGD